MRAKKIGMLQGQADKPPDQEENQAHIPAEGLVMPEFDDTIGSEDEDVSAHPASNEDPAVSQNRATSLAVIVDAAPEHDHGQPIPALQMLRNARRYTAVATGVGLVSRGIVTLCTTFEDTASIADLLLTYTRFFLIFILFGVIFFGLGSTVVTWGFWTPQVQDYTAGAVDWVRACCGLPPSRQALIEESNEEAGCSDQVTTSLPWLTYVTASCSMATLGLVANENEMGTREMLGWTSPTWGTALFSLSTGVIATVYSGFTDLDSVWQARWANREVVTVRRPPTGLIYVVTFLGSLELFYRTWIVIYLTSLELNDSRILGFVLSSFFTICSTIQNFCFQTSYALEGSAFLRAFKLAMINMSLPAKVVFLIAIGATTIIVNMAMPTFNVSTLLPTIFNEHLGIVLSPHLVMALAIATAAGITWGDILSSFWGGVVQQTMGWDQPDNLFLHGGRSQAFRMGFSYRENRQGGPSMYSRSPRIEEITDEEARLVEEQPGQVEDVELQEQGNQALSYGGSFDLE